MHYYLVTKEQEVCVFKGAEQSVDRTQVIKTGTFLNGSLIGDGLTLWVFLDEDGEGEFFFPVNKTKKVPEAEVDWDNALGD
jgi:hypothetical protein